MLGELPPAPRQEAVDFIRFLMEKNGHDGNNRLKLDWAGGLREYRHKYTSLELQKKALEWWGD